MHTVISMQARHRLSICTYVHALFDMQPCATRAYAVLCDHVAICPLICPYMPIWPCAHMAMPMPHVQSPCHRVETEYETEYID